MFHNPFLNFCFHSYRKIISWVSRLQSLFLVLIRVMWGHLFIILGYVQFHKIEELDGLFAAHNIPWPHTSAYLAASLETIGGILLFVGLASRLICIPLIIMLLAAYTSLHEHIFTGLHFFWNPALLFHEDPFSYLLVCLVILIFGPGKVSLDAYFKRKLERRYSHWGQR